MTRAALRAQVAEALKVPPCSGHAREQSSHDDDPSNFALYWAPNCGGCCLIVVDAAFSALAAAGAPEEARLAALRAESPWYGAAETWQAAFAQESSSP